jgi:NAD(P)-dependent dehydrogenase (short-subunit alcohol dehydrogenase family)
MKKKIALVSGGSRGLGKNMAIKLALKGLDVIITYQSRQEEASRVVEEIKKAGGKATALQLNIGDVRSFGPFFEQVAEVLKVTFNTDCFDYLINNAGIGMNVPFADTTEEQFDQMMNVQRIEVSGGMNI